MHVKSASRRSENGFLFNGIRKPIGFFDAIEVKSIGFFDRVLPICALMLGLLREQTLHRFCVEFRTCSVWYNIVLLVLVLITPGKSTTV